MKLISMKDYMFLQYEVKREGNTKQEVMVKHVKVLYNYANFLNEPLTLGMFVPCDLEGNIFSEPKKIGAGYAEEAYTISLKQYKEAKQRLLFGGFNFKVADWCDEIVFELDFNGNYINYEHDDKIFIEPIDEMKYKIIEHLLHLNLTLTPQAIEKYNL